MSPPGGIAEVLQSLLLSVVDNPVNALISANFIGILAWAIGLGIAFRHASDTTRNLLSELSNGVSLIVKVVIRFARWASSAWSPRPSPSPASRP